MAGHDRAGFAVVTSHSCVWRQHAGFTMVELVVVLILVGILGAVAMARFDRDTFTNAAFADQAASMIRYAQKLAIAQHRPVFVFAEADRISLCFSAATPCPATEQVGAPAGTNTSAEATRTNCASSSWYCEGRPAAVNYKIEAGSNPVGFDALGRPTHANGTDFTSFSIIVDPDREAIRVSVAEETGYVSR